MKLNGIWQVEMAGLYGWETVGTAFLEDGKYWSGSENHHAVGSYEVSGDHITISVVSVQHGKVRTVFGKKQRQQNLTVEGKVKKDKIEGQAYNEDRVYQVSYRSNRLADLP